MVFLSVSIRADENHRKMIRVRAAPRRVATDIDFSAHANGQIFAKGICAVAIDVTRVTDGH
jgi:hypothetical protein